MLQRERWWAHEMQLGLLTSSAGSVAANAGFDVGALGTILLRTGLLCIAGWGWRGRCCLPLVFAPLPGFEVLCVLLHNARAYVCVTVCLTLYCF